MTKLLDASIELSDNAMLKKCPELFDLWDFVKNDELGLDIYKVTQGSSKVVWWNGECGHNYDIRVGDATRGQRCPYCANSRVLKGFNDMWTTNSELAKLLVNKEDGYKYTQGSKERLDWFCKSCNSDIKNRRVMDVKNYGLNCGICKGSLKYPERMMKAVLDELSINYIHDKEMVWSENKRYDFYLTDYNVIIETHGGQHFEQGFDFTGGRDLEEEINNDKYKLELAIENNISYYVVIDCRRSEFNFIKSSILSSQLVKMFDLELVDWDEVKRKVNRNLLQTIAEDWAEFKSSKEVAKRNRIPFKKITNLLLDATNSGYCKYSEKEDLYLLRESIYKIDRNMIVVGEYIKDDELFEVECISLEHVMRAISNKTTYQEHYWCKSKNWESRKHLYESIEKEKRDKKLNPVLQIDMNGTILKRWANPIEILDAHNDYLSAPLYNAMNGNQNSYKGFIWVKEKEYNIKEVEDKINKMKESGLARVKNRLILQINKFTGEIVGEVRGVKNASKMAGVAETTMARCIYKKRKTTGGYIWIYDEEYKTEEGLKWVEDIINSNK